MAFVCSFHLSLVLFSVHIKTVDSALRSFPDVSTPNLRSKCVGPDCIGKEVTDNAAAHVDHRRLREDQKFQRQSLLMFGYSGGDEKGQPRQTASISRSTFGTRVTESRSPPRLEEEGQCAELRVSNLKFTEGKVNLAGMDDPGWGTVDPYCILKVDNQPEQRAETITDDARPDWGPTQWRFDIDNGSDADLTISCYDSDRWDYVSPDDEIGERKFIIDVDKLPYHERKLFQNGDGEVYIEFDADCIPACPSSTNYNLKTCLDGHRNSSSCKDHGGILKCPLKFPFMCTETDEHGDHECREKPSGCKSLLRTCPTRCGIMFLPESKRIALLPGLKHNISGAYNNTVPELRVDEGYVVQVFERHEKGGKDCQLQVGSWKLSEAWHNKTSSYSCQKVNSSAVFPSVQVQYGDEIIIQNQHQGHQLLRGRAEPELSDSFNDEQIFREKVAVWKLLRTTNQSDTCVLFGDDILIESQHDGKKKLSTSNSVPALISTQNDIVAKAAVWKILNMTEQGQGCVFYGDNIVLQNQNAEVDGPRILQRDVGLKLTNGTARIRPLAAVWQFLDASKAMPSCLANVCQCNHGTPVASANCATHGATKCLPGSCAAGYHFEKDACEANVCLCNHGTPVASANCATHGATTCVPGSCVPGFHLKQDACEANVCQCEHGTPAAGANCTTHGATKCVPGSCVAGFHFEQDTCEANVCKCKHGTPVASANCTTHGATKCMPESCVAGSRFEDDACNRIACLLFHDDDVFIQNQFTGRWWLQSNKQEPIFLHNNLQTRNNSTVWKVLHKSKRDKGCISYGDEILLESHYGETLLLERDGKPKFTKLFHERLDNGAAVWKVWNKLWNGKGCIFYGDDILLENQLDEKLLLERNVKPRFTVHNDERIDNGAAVWKILNTTTLPSSCSNGAATLIKANVQCNSINVYLGETDNLGDCAQKCLSKPGCEHVIYGKGGTQHQCYWKKTASANCDDSREEDQYDFYSVKSVAASI